MEMQPVALRLVTLRDDVLVVSTVKNTPFVFAKRTRLRSVVCACTQNTN